MKVSLIVPTLNEEGNLTLVLPKLSGKPTLDEVVIIDGESTDGTVELARRLLPERSLCTA